MKLWQQIFIGMGAGLVVGFILRAFEFNPETFLPLGTLFLNLIKMLVVLLVFSSMTAGICSIHDPKKLGRVGGRALLFYFLTTLVAIGFGLAFGFYFNIGTGFSPEFAAQNVTLAEPKSLVELFTSIVPSNPIAAFASGNTLQVIVFSTFLGLAINLAGEKGMLLRQGVESLAAVMGKLVTIVMRFAPIGVFGIMTWVAGKLGLQSLLHLAKFITLYYVACFLFVGLVFCGILRFVAGLKVIPFFRGLWEAIIFAFTTGSSSATLPIAMRCAEEKLGVTKHISNFILPLGIALNMNGTALFQGMSAVFVAEMYGVHLDAFAILTIVFTVIMASIGTSGIPGQGFIMMSVVLNALGLPFEGMFVLAAIDRLRDMIGTALNVMGDTLVAVVLAKQEGELDEKIYNQNVNTFATREVES